MSRKPDVGDLVSCLADAADTRHIRRIVARAFEPVLHEELLPRALCGISVYCDTLDPVDETDCPECGKALKRVPR